MIFAANPAHEGRSKGLKAHTTAHTRPQRSGNNANSTTEGSIPRSAGTLDTENNTLRHPRAARFRYAATALPQQVRVTVPSPSSLHLPRPFRFRLRTSAPRAWASFLCLSAFSSSARTKALNSVSSFRSSRAVCSQSCRRLSALYATWKAYAWYHGPASGGWG